MVNSRQCSSILIRADASTSIGMGHVMRCLAIAQACQDKGSSVSFVMGSNASRFDNRLISEGFDVFLLPSIELGTLEDAIETIRLAKQQQAKWIIVDGYHFTDHYQRALKQAGYPLLVIDDCGYLEQYEADIILNQNISAQATLYPHCSSSTKLLLGLPYTLLRQEFWAYQKWQRDYPATAKKILITLGGSDPDNVTLEIIKQIQQLAVFPMLDVLVVVGGSNPHTELLQKAILGTNIRLVRNVSNMPELMAWADMAITAGGSTCWEAAFMQLPSLVIVLADNQLNSAQTLAQTGLVELENWYLDGFSSNFCTTLKQLISGQEARMTMGERGRQLVDGKGVYRVIEKMEEGEYEDD